MNTIDHAGIEWDIIEGIRSWTPYDREYCADGDGLVRVSQRTKGCFKGFLVFDQTDYQGKYNTLEEALNRAADILKEWYPSVYDSLYFGDDDSEPAHQD